MLKDLRYALHIIAKDRWYSAVAVVALSLGIGVNATVFTLVNAVLIRGLPYKDSSRLYVLSSQRQNDQNDGVSAADLQDWRTQAKSFEALGASFVEVKILKHRSRNLFSRKTNDVDLPLEVRT